MEVRRNFRGLSILSDRPLTVLWVGSDNSKETSLSDAHGDGCVVVHARPGDAPRCLASFSVDVVALEESPLTLATLKLCSRLARASRLPVVIVSETAAEDWMVLAFRAEASDYLLLPLSGEELRARLASIARRHRGVGPTDAGDDIVGLSGLTVYPRERRVSLGERQLQLTGTEFELLLCLARAAGNPVTHDELLGTVWGPEYLDCRHYLRLYIRYLREKIEAQPAHPQFILNERGIGYRLNAGVVASN